MVLINEYEFDYFKQQNKLFNNIFKDGLNDDR